MLGTLEISEEDGCSPEQSIPFLAGALIHKRALKLGDVPTENCGTSDGDSTVRVALNLMNAIIGAGVLSLPFAFREAGACMGLVVIGLAFLMTTTLWMIGHVMGCLDHVATRAGIPRGSRNWTMLGTMVFGRVGRFLIPTLFVADLYPTVVAYTIMAGDNTHMLAPDVNLSTHILILNCAVFILLFVPLRYFSIFSAMGILAQVSSLLALVVTGIELQVSQPHAHVERRFFKSDTALGASGIVVFLFTAHSTVPMLYQSMQNREEWPRACIMAGAGSSIFYMLVGCVCYSIFGSKTLQVFSVNLGRDLSWNVLESPLPEAFNRMLGPGVGVMIAFKLMVTFPVFARPVLDCVKESLSAQSSPYVDFAIKVAYSLSIAFFAAFLKNYVAFVMEFVGCVVHSSMVVLLPCALYLRVCRPSGFFKIFLCIFALCFTVYMPVGFVQIVHHLLRPCEECSLYPKMNEPVSM